MGVADWVLRGASAGDVEAIAELRADVLRGDLERVGRYDAGRVRQRLRDGFVAGHTWVIEVGGEFAGCVALRGSPARRLYERFGFVVEAEDAVDVFMVREAGG